MKFIKLGLISAVLLFLLLTAISALLPSTINISRAIDINAPADSIYRYLNDVSLWNTWFANYDSSTVSFSKNTVGKGASIVLSNTRVSIVENKPGQIRSLWRTGSKSLDGAFNLFAQDSSSLVTLQWHFIHRVKWYPWEKFASIASDKVMGPVMEQSLDNLKKVVEK